MLFSYALNTEGEVLIKSEELLVDPITFPTTSSVHTSVSPLDHLSTLSPPVSSLLVMFVVLQNGILALKPPVASETRERALMEL